MRSAAIGFVLLLTACDTLAGVMAPMPMGRVRFTPDTVYLTWWREVEACSGKRFSMRRVEWYYYPGQPLIPGTSVGSQTRNPGHNTYFADTHVGDPWRRQPFTVRHEMLHHMPGVSGHDEDYFGSQANGTFGKCGHIVMRP